MEGLPVVRRQSGQTNVANPCRLLVPVFWLTSSCADAQGPGMIRRARTVELIESTVRNRCFETVVEICSFWGSRRRSQRTRNSGLKSYVLSGADLCRLPCFSDNQAQAPRLSIALEGCELSLGGCRVS